MSIVLVDVRWRRITSYWGFDERVVAHSALFTASVAQVARSYDLNNFTHEEFLSFYINTYNILAVKMIIDHPCERALRRARRAARCVEKKNGSSCLNARAALRACMRLGDVFGDCRPLPSIRSASGNLGSVWNSNAGVVNNKTVSLDEIESTLRAPGNYGFRWSEDSRIHSAINCASIRYI